MQKAEMNRRRFLGMAGSAIAVPYVITSSALGAGGRAPANDRIVMATIGCGVQGTSDMQAFLGLGCETGLFAISLRQLGGRGD